MDGEPAKNFHGVCIGPLSKILAQEPLMVKTGSYLSEAPLLHENLSLFSKTFREKIKKVV